MLTELERWQNLARRTGAYLVAWSQKYPAVKLLAPSLGLVGAALQEMALDKLEHLLDEAERKG